MTSEEIKESLLDEKVGFGGTLFTLMLFHLPQEAGLVGYALGGSLVFAGLLIIIIATVKAKKETRP